MSSVIITPPASLIQQVLPQFLIWTPSVLTVWPFLMLNISDHGEGERDRGQRRSCWCCCFYGPETNRYPQHLSFGLWFHWCFSFQPWDFSYPALIPPPCCLWFEFWHSDWWRPGSGTSASTKKKGLKGKPRSSDQVTAGDDPDSTCPQLKSAPDWVLLPSNQLKQ